jgi:Berberine and berberine like
MPQPTTDAERARDAARTGAWQEVLREDRLRPQGRPLRRRARPELAGEDHDQVPATYRHNYRRLVEVKRRHDPDNLFRLNQNVHPASLPAAAPTR